ncbi:MAG: helix-turn-helix domain-containing protein [Bacteroidota bacterium]
MKPRKKRYYLHPNATKLFYPAYFTSNTNSESEDVNSSHLPDFLKKINDHIQQNLSDETLNVQRLTRLIGMSRSDLHRKLTKATGLSATAYIRLVRLRRAADLLWQHPEWGIYQVALEVGFGNQSYFSRRFKEVFGVSPVDWRASQRDMEHMLKELGHK